MIDRENVVGVVEPPVAGLAPRIDRAHSTAMTRIVQHLHRSGPQARRAP